VAYELKTGGVLLHPIFGGGKEKDKYVNCLEIIFSIFFFLAVLGFELNPALYHLSFQPIKLAL
jgi:hypothetical protein